MANQKPEFTPSIEYTPINYTTAILAFLAVVIFLIAISLTLEDAIFKSSRRATLNIGFPAPDFRYPNLDGKMVSLSDHKGKVVLVNIWATWCPPCVEEMPSMQKLYQELTGIDFEILAVSIDALGAKVVAPFMKKYNLTFPALIDTEGTIKTTYQATGVPESFIIDKEGILVKKVIGSLNWSSPEVYRFFRTLIQTPLSKKENVSNLTGKIALAANKQSQSFFNQRATK